jgi:hypothetical protein
MKMSVSNEVAQVAGNTAIGVTGGITSLWMSNINEYVSFFIGIATLIYLIVSIYKKVKEMRNG